MNVDIDLPYLKLLFLIASCVVFFNIGILPYIEYYLNAYCCVFVDRPVKKDDDKKIIWI